MQLTANYIHQIESENLKRYQQRREDLVLMLSNEKKRFSVDGIDKENIETLDFFRNSTSAGDLYVDAVLESSRTLEYAAVLRYASPSIPSA